MAKAVSSHYGQIAKKANATPKPKKKKKKKEEPRKQTGTQRHRGGKVANTSKGDERRGKETVVQNKSNAPRAHGANPSGKRTVRSGATAARAASKTNPVTQGVRYVAADKAKTVVTAPTKIVAGTLKNSQNTAGQNRHRSGINNTKRTDRMTSSQRTRYHKVEVSDTTRKRNIEEQKKRNEQNGYGFANSTIKKLDSATARNTKKFEEAKEDALKKGASGLSDKKHNIPIYTKWAKGKATEEAKNALKEAGITRAKGKKQVDDWVKEQEKKYDLKDDTVLEDGTTWAEYKKKAYKDQDDAILKQQAEYIKNATKDAGKMSAQDAYKMGVPMASEMIDYAVPYMGTAKGSIKVAEKIIEKATKAGKVGKGAAKTAPKLEKAVDDLVKSGQLTPQAAKVLNKKIALRSGAKSLSKEALANALQDATIGTAIDLQKGISEGYKGEDLEKYMKENAIANLVMGAPLSAIAGRAGAKELKNSMAEGVAKQVNELTNLTKPDAIKLEALLKKQDKGTITSAEQKTLSDLQNKALGGGTAVVNRKGQIEANKAENAINDLSKAEVAEFYKLKSQATRGSLDPRDTARYNELQTKVQTAYKRTEEAANAAINIKGRKIQSRDQSDMENAVRFFERTGDKAKLEQAQKSLNIAKEQTRKLNESLGKATGMMTEKTGINYKWVDDEEMYNLTGEYGNQGFTDTKTGEVVINRDSPQAWQAVLGHETGHVIKASNEEAFKALGDSLEKYAKELGEYEQLEAVMRANYPEFREKPEDFREEMVSEMLGRYVFGEDDKFIKKLAGEEPTTLQRIIAYIRRLVANTDNKELIDQFTKLQDNALKAIDDAKKADWKERGLVESTGNAGKRFSKAQVDKTSQLAPVSGKDGMYSYAYEAANKLGKTVKSDADSLLKYFQKKGVTAEEMKWTGLGDYIRANSPLSKQQLLDFIDANNYELYTVVRANDEYATALGKKYNESTRKELQNILKKDRDLLEDISETLGMEEQKILEQPRKALRAYGLEPDDMVEPPNIPDYAKWEQYSLRGGKNYREYEYVDPRMTGYSNQAMDVHWSGDNDVVVHSRIQDFTAQSAPKYLDDMDVNVETVSAVGDHIEDMVRYAGERPTYTKIDWLDEDFGVPVEIEVFEPKMGEVSAHITSTETGELYSEIVKQPRDAIADAVANELHRLGRDGEIVTFKANKGENKVLHVEEIQSDWHNAGQKNGYTKGDLKQERDNAQRELDSLKKNYLETNRKLRAANKEFNESGFRMFVSEKAEQNIRELIEQRASIGDRINQLEDKINRIGDTPPEAPYKNNYTDYAMKRALREAVENDYDIISWTTAKQQADRWSDEYMEGYRIEYDQDIPSFMKRYVKQWGGEVEKLRLAENGEEVWGVRITDEMRDSIREKGQRRFSRAGKNAQGVDKPMAELAENLYDNGRGLSRAEIKRLTGWDVDTDGKAKFEFSDKDMKLKLKMKDLRGLDEGRLDDIIEHGEMFKYYPKFKDINVQFVSRSYMDGADGEYIPELNMLRVAKGQNKTETEKTILHELQHAIQNEEGFASGASPEFYEDVWRNMTEELNRYKEDLPNGVDADDYGAIDLIRSYDGDEVATKYERLLDARNELRGQFKGYGFRGNEAADELVESGKIPYANTKGEIEARETEARRDKSQEWLDEHPREPDKNEIFREKYDKYYRKFSRSKNSKKDTTLDGEIQSILKDKHLKSGSEKALEEDLRAVAKLVGEDKVDEAIQKTQELVRKHMEIDEYEAVDNSIDQNVKEIIKSAPINIAELGDGTIAHKLENIGLTRDDVPYWVQLRSKKGGMPLDRVYQVLSDERPDLFSPDATHEDKLKNIIDAATKRPEKTRKPQDWIDGERQDLELSIFSKVADGVFADRKVAEAAKNVETARTETDTRMSEEQVEGSEQQSMLKETPKKAEKPKKEEKEDTRSEVQKLRDSQYVSDNVKTALKDIEDAGVNTERAEKAAKKYNELDKKLGGEYKHLENAKNKEYDTDAEKSAHIAELEENIRVLKDKQKKLAGEIEQLGKMKAVDPNKTWQEERAGLEHNKNRKVNRADTTKLKDEDNWIQSKVKSVRRLMEDSLIDVESAAKGRGIDKKLREELLTSANRVRNSASTTNFWVTRGRKSFDNKVGGKALDEIFPKSLIKDEKKYNDFQEYLVMKHVDARHKKGTDIYPDVSPEKAQKIIDGLEDDYGDEIKNWAKDVYDYLKDLQQYRVDSGILSKEAAEQFAKDYPFYVPTNRARDDEPIQFFTGGLSNQIRTARGGEAPVLDMYSQLYTATNKTLHAAEENQMLNLYFRAKGVSKEELLDAKLPDLEHAAINATVNKKTGASKISFFVDGTPVEYACSHQLALGIREMDGLEFERLMKYAKMATLYGRPFKALITDWNLVFGVRNGARDFQQALVNTKDLKYFGSSLGAAAHAVANADSPYRKAYASMGGEQAQLVSYDAVAQQMGLEKGKIDRFHEGLQDFVDVSVNIKGKEVHTNVLHWIEGANGAIEMMPRMSEFIGTLRKEADKTLRRQGSSLDKLRKEIIEQAKKDGVGQTVLSEEVENRLAERVLELAGKDALDSAMRNANDITLNFGRSGVIGKALNMGFVPYLNPSIQGLSKLIRLFTETGGEGGMKALASLGMKLGTFTILPTVWNEFALRNDENYQNLNTRDKDNNFFISLAMLGEDYEGKYIKFPKPRENAVLAEPVEYGLRYIFDEAEYAFFDWDKLTMHSESLFDKIPLTGEGKQAFQTAIDNIGVINPLTSNMVSPLVQTFNNKTWYGGSIESAYETATDDNGNPNVAVKDRKDTGTTALAIWLGKTRGAQALNLSPKKIDNILDSYTGMIYDLGLSQTTEEARSRGNYFVRTIASQFVKDSVFSNKLSTKAWDKIDKMTPAEQDKYKGTYMYDTYKYDDAMDVITSDKNMTDQEKMAAKRELMKKKNQLNRSAIEGTANKSNPLSDIAKFIGATKTLENFLPEQNDEDGKPSEKDWESYFKRYKNANNYKGLTAKQQETASKAFLTVYTLGVKGQKVATPDSFHDAPKWGMTGVAIAQSYKNGKITEKQADAIATSCGVWENSRNASNKYVDKDGNVIELGTSNKRANKTLDKVKGWGIDTDSGLWKGGYSKSMNAKGGTIAMSLATDKDTEFKDRSYYIENFSDPMCLDKMNAARGFAKKYKHKTKEIPQLALQADALGDSNTYLKNDEIIEACKAQDGWSDEERAMGYILLGGSPKKNPFGEIGDYSIDGDTGIEADDEDKGKGGRGRRGRRRGGWGHGGGGGGGGGTPFTPVVNTAGGAAKQTITKVKVSDVTKPTDYTKPSNLNDAYRKRVRKLREQTRKRK